MGGGHIVHGVLSCVWKEANSQTPIVILNMFLLKCQVHKCSLKPCFTLKTALLIPFEHSCALFPFSTFRRRFAKRPLEYIYIWSFPHWPSSTTTAQTNEVKLSLFKWWFKGYNRYANLSVSGWMWRYGYALVECERKSFVPPSGSFCSQYLSVYFEHARIAPCSSFTTATFFVSLFVYTCEMEWVSVALQVQRSISPAGGR